jgi:hypothetical protein
MLTGQRFHKCLTGYSDRQAYGETMAQFEYRVRVRLASGRVLRAAPFLTPRERGLGDLVQLPVRADGELQPGERFDWRVTAIEDGGKVLVLEFLHAA